MAETAGGIYYPTKEDNFDLENDLPKMAESVEERCVGIIPAGSVIATARSSAPAGYLICDGSPVSRMTYKALFEAIGTGYGVGDGSTTFNLPSLVERVPIGKGGAAPFKLGETGGEKTHTLTEAEMPAHSHEVAGKSIGYSTGSTFDSVPLGPTNTTAFSTKSKGGGGSHNNMQPYAVVNYMIKT